MRLLRCGAGHEPPQITDDLPDIEIPPYTILSHTWGKAEITMRDLAIRTPDKQSAAYRKLQFFLRASYFNRYAYCWMNTCCIDKTNNSELTEAINSMFRWYRDAGICLVCLEDVSAEPMAAKTQWIDQFKRSRWFRRGWTLQELIAPRTVRFYTAEGNLLGDKVSLEQDIVQVTGIEAAALRGDALERFSVEQRLGWAAGRLTTKTEDQAYSLLGIFDVHMPLIYGERDKAMARLKDHLTKHAASVGPAISGAPGMATTQDIELQTEQAASLKSLAQPQWDDLDSELSWMFWQACKLEPERYVNHTSLKRAFELCRSWDFPYTMGNGLVSHDSVLKFTKRLGLENLAQTQKDANRSVGVTDALDRVQLQRYLLVCQKAWEAERRRERLQQISDDDNGTTQWQSIQYRM